MSRKRIAASMEKKKKKKKRETKVKTSETQRKPAFLFESKQTTIK